MRTPKATIFLFFIAMAMAFGFAIPAAIDADVKSSASDYKIIPITDAVRLDEKRNALENIYQAVSVKDSRYAAVESGQYVRVQFEKNLSSDNDITLYAKSQVGATIEVYIEGGEKIIATFATIKEEGFYKVGLAGIGNPEDVFDLKITGNAEIDFITDPSSGPNSGATFADDSGTGSIAWSSTGNVATNDGTYALAGGITTPDTTHYLKATNFGFSIPVGATINGIVVQWIKLSDENTFAAFIKDNAVRIVKGGTIGSTDKSIGTDWAYQGAGPGSYTSYGSSSDLWGGTWTASDINSSTFGAAISAKCSATCTNANAYLDNVIITVYYTVANVSISGTVYTDEGTTTMGSGRTVSVSINGAAAAGSTTTASNGTYSITGLTVNTGDVLTLYLDNNTEKGVTVTVGTGSNLTGINIYQNYLIARQDNGGSLTNANLNTAAGNGDSDISSIYGVSSGTLTLASALGASLFIPASNTFAPGGNVSVAGNFTNNGTYTKGTETVTLAAGASKTLKTNGSSFYNVTVDGVGGTYALQDTLTATSVLTLTNGTFNANNNNISTPAFSSSNSNTRTISMGTGTWTLSGTGTVWTTATATNLTITPGTSTIAITDTSSTSKTFAGGGKTYYDITITGVGTGAFVLTGANTFHTFTLNTNTAKTLTFPASATTTITGTFSVSGQSGQLLTINSSLSGTAATLSKANGTVSCNYLSLQDSAATGGAVWNAGSNSTNVSGNTGWNFGTLAPPVPSGFNPANGSTIKTATPNITFILDEAGDCKASTTNASYSAMSGADCTGDGSTGGACLMPSLGSNGSKTIYFACQDTDGNQDTSGSTHSVTYTLSLSSGTSSPTLTIKGSGKFKGSGAIK